MNQDWQALYVQLGRLVETVPDMSRHPQPTSAVQWLARAYALTKEVDLVEAQVIRDAMQWLASDAYQSIYPSYVNAVMQALYRVLALAEMKAPAVAQGAFIPAGNAFDALAALGKVLGSAKHDLLIIDPYMDEKILIDFAAMADEKVRLRLLADQKTVKATLRPAAHRWAQQYSSNRPLEAKLSDSGSLHDRLIIVDQAEAWILTQSFNAFASRSPASISRSDPEVAALKIPYYEAVWSSANPL